MEARTDILNELDELSPLLYGMEKVNVFSVPEGYFNTLDEIILSVVIEDEAEFLTSISKENKQEVPEGYFDHLADSIFDKIRSADTIQSAADELRELSPMLYSIQNENVFNVPANYFDTFSNSIVEKIQPKAKVVSMPKTNNWLRYAAAATIAILLSLGIFTFINSGDKQTATEMARLDPYIIQGKDMSDKQFNTTLDQLSSDEIINYLEKNSDEMDVASLSQSIDESTLPSEDDYFIDDKTLEKYLQQIDL